MKSWLIEVVVKKMGPSLVRAALAALIAGIAAHAEILNALGIVYDAAANTIVIHLTTTSVWASTVGLGGLTALIMGLQHHAAAAITGEPQSGNPVLENRRETDKQGGTTDEK